MKQEFYRREFMRLLPLKGHTVMSNEVKYLTIVQKNKAKGDKPRPYY